MAEAPVASLPKGLAAFDLAGHVALVTGASSGIGRSFARAIVEAGGKVVMAARREERLQEMVGELGADNAAYVVADVGDLDSLPAMAAAARKPFGDPDIVVNVAGNTVRKAAEDLSPAEFLAVIQVQLMAPLHVAQQFHPAMKAKGWGRVINIGSITTSHALPGTTAYAACKSGVAGLTRAMAKDWGPDGITANAICPGFFPTELTQPVVDDAKRWQNNARPHIPWPQRRDGGHARRIDHAVLRSGSVYVWPDDLCGCWLHGKLNGGAVMPDPVVRDVIAYLSVNDADKAIAWYGDVFGAVEAGAPLRMPDGKIVHCEIHIGDTPIFLAEAADDGLGGSPNDLGGTPVRMALNAKDADATVAAAANAGAEVLIPVADQFYGQRAGRIRDPFGHVWLISLSIEDVSPRRNAAPDGRHDARWRRLIDLKSIAGGLPIEAVLPDLLAALAAGTSAVLVAPPGAGKSTLAPLALLGVPWAEDRRILMLAPRRLAVRAAAGRMASLLGEQVGETIGYRVRMESKISKRTRIEVMTEGVFTRMALADPELQGVAAVLFDEFHERSLDADFGLALALDIQQSLRPDLRILPMSATLDDMRLAALLGDAPVVRSEGRAFPIETHYLGRARERWIDEAMAAAIRKALVDEMGGILAFLPGRAEIERTEKRLIEAGLDAEKISLHQLHGGLDPRAQDRAVKAG